MFARREELQLPEKDKNFDVSEEDPTPRRAVAASAFTLNIEGCFFN